jgi:hypothetical protein
MNFSRGENRVKIRRLLTRLGIALALWLGSMFFCALYSNVHPSSLAYVALFLLVGWYIYIPIFFVVVIVASFVAEAR